MAMTTASQGGLQANINMTPMIDVLLVLLIIFMAISPTQSHGLSALVPLNEQDNQARAPESPVVLEIGADGGYSINSQPLEHSMLAARLTEIFKSRGTRALFVKAAPDLEFAVVANAIDIAHEANVDRVALMPRN
jgi:biopolymer transport protein ExbD